MVSGATAIYLNGHDFLGAAIACNLIAVFTALAAWSGALWKDAQAPATWRGWVGIFFGAGMISGVFVAIDIVLVHPGISLAFTIGALALTFIALPSALRAWIQERLSRRGGELD
ncbi:hypothetical protein LP420_38735 [Massilia sp. B-10]|nr:hypothetical protein LP420_38735 [Massilia sp. B-10]